jgi:type I restriction enzyme, S subunit
MSAASPAQWRVMFLGEICELKYGSSLPARLRNGGVTPVMGSNGVIGYHDKALTSGATIVIGRKGSYGEVHLCDTPCWPIDTTYYVDELLADADLRWLAYCLKALRLPLLSNSSTVPGLNRNDAYALRVGLPPLAEQHRIVAILDEAAELQRLRREADRRTAELVPAIFDEVFGDPATNPKGWPLRLLSDVGELDRGRSRHRPRNDPRLLGGPYPFVQTGDVANARGFITSFTHTYSEFGLAQSRIWPPGTLCITIAANIAKTAILTFPACFPDSVVGFVPRSHVLTEYVRHWLVCIEETLEELAPQSAQKNINLKILSELSIPLPPIALQREFAKRVAAVRALAAMQATARTHLDALSQSLLERALRGDLA